MYTQQITSLQHPIIKHLVKLRKERAYRAECGTLLITGTKLVSELAYMLPFKTLLIADNYAPAFPLKADRIFTAPLALLKKVTGLETPEPLAAEVPLPPQASLVGVKKLLVLDGIADPGNVGTLFRTALALKWDGIFLTPQTSDPFNDKALRAAKGATFKLPYRIGTSEELIALIQKENLTLLIADSQGNPSRASLPTCALVLGNESHGVSEPLKQIGTWIGIALNPEVESLNVAAAGAILMDRLNV